jgi:O-antigen ligase
MLLLLNERRRNPDASAALWLPTLWIVISGSRPIAGWFEASTLSSGESAEAGSPIDRWTLIILILLALRVLSRRKFEWSKILKDNSWLVLLYLYLALSILWSDYPFTSFKRWIRLAGAIPIASVVLSEASPLKAMASVFRRTAYILIPFSVLLIKYFPDLGRQYNRWTGELMWTGVADQKNGLGLICALSAFFFLWTFFRDWRANALLKTKSRTLADALVLATAILLLRGPGGSYSATSATVLILGTTSMLLLHRSRNNLRPMAHLLFLAILLLLICLPFVTSLISTSSSILGRDESFTGRTDIWRLALDEAARHRILGAGFGSYFGIQNEHNEFWARFNLNTGHNGYLDVYVELGIVGVALLLAFLLAHYRRVLRQLTHARDWGVFGLSLTLMWLLYNVTESDFIKTSSYFWNTMVFLTVVFSAPILSSNVSAPVWPSRPWREVNPCLQVELPAHDHCPM